MTETIDTNSLLADLPWIDRPGADIEEFAAKYKKVSFDLSEKLHEWRDNGYVIFREAVDPRLIDDFLEEIALLRENSRKYLISIEIKGQQTWTQAVPREALQGPGVKFNHLHVSSLYAARLSLTRVVTEFLEALFGSPATPTQSLTFWMGSQQPTHIDYPYVRQQRRLAYMAASWIPLEDVSMEAGPLAYYPGAHRPEICGFFDWGHGDILCRKETQVKSSMEFANWLDLRLSAANVDPVIFLPKKGDVLIWHWNMPHAGTKVSNSEKTRKSYVTHFTGVDDYPRSWIPIESEIYRENGGVVFDFPWSKPESKLPSWEKRQLHHVY